MAIHAFKSCKRNSKGISKQITNPLLCHYSISRWLMAVLNDSFDLEYDVQL